jgi:hypothetical protein
MMFRFEPAFLIVLKGDGFLGFVEFFVEGIGALS